LICGEEGEEKKKKEGKKKVRQGLEIFDGQDKTLREVVDNNNKSKDHAWVLNGSPGYCSWATHTRRDQPL
jgi:hypothetical protein